MSNGANVRRGLSELGIVVLGVVIALAADGWRQDLSDRRLESDYLARLHSDLVADRDAMTSLQARLSVAQQASLELVAAIEVDPSSTDDSAIVALVLASTRVGFVREEMIHDATYRELASTGRLALIRDADVRSTTVQHYRRVEGLAQLLEEIPDAVAQKLWRATGHRAAHYLRDEGQLSVEDQTRLLREFRDAPGTASDLRELHTALELTTFRLEMFLPDLAALLNLFG